MVVDKNELKIKLDNMLGEDYNVFRVIDKWETVTCPTFPYTKILLFDGKKITKKPLIRYPSGDAFFIINGKKYSLNESKETKNFFLPDWYTNYTSINFNNVKINPTIKESLILEGLEKQLNQLLVQLGLL